MELEKDYKKEKGSGHSTTSAYTVEARASCGDPKQIGSQIFDSKWRRVAYEKGAIGVPPCSILRKEVAEHGMLGYSAAQALRWWLHANADVSEMLGGLCLETRLIKHILETTHSIKAEGFYKVVGGDDRSSSMPDWGEK